jgi:hypothetical protein
MKRKTFVAFEEKSEIEHKILVVQRQSDAHQGERNHFGDGEHAHCAVEVLKVASHAFADEASVAVVTSRSG